MRRARSAPLAGGIKDCIVIGLLYTGWIERDRCALCLLSRARRSESPAHGHPSSVLSLKKSNPSSAQKIIKIKIYTHFPQVAVAVAAVLPHIGILDQCSFGLLSTYTFAQIWDRWVLRDWDPVTCPWHVTGEQFGALRSGPLDWKWTAKIKTL
jgi:hypothetical protein